MTIRIGTTAPRLILGAAMGAIGLSALAAENNPGLLDTGHVDKISVKQSGATPVIEVSASGDQYDTVADNEFSMHYDAAVSCKGLWDVHYFEVALGAGSSWYTIKGLNYQHKDIGSYTDLLAMWGVDTQKKSMSFSGRTLMGPLKPQLRDAAIKTCKVETQKIADDRQISLLKAMSTQRQFPLPKTGWVASNLRLQAWTSCGKPQDFLTWLSVFDDPPDINVVCKARPYAEGVDTGHMPSQVDNQFQVTQLALSANPDQYQGSCPKDLVLTGTIAASKAGSLNYQWKSGNTMSAPSKLTFTKAGSRQVTRTIEVDHSWSQSFTLVTDAMGKKESNSVDVNFSCVRARGPTDDKQAPKPPLPPPPPPPPPLPPPPPPMPKSDLVLGGTLTVGNNTAQWGHTLTANASKSELGMQGNACGLHLSYDVKNVGQGDAAAFTSRLFTQAGTLHSGNVPALKAGETTQISGTIFLPNGDYEVSVAADSLMKVAESDEGNNTAQLHLKIRNCTHP